MPLATILCEQAIFTSIRSPMGEGYRVVAASRGLKPDERQAITRHSPSHDALCDGDTDSDPEGNAFYLLPSGRFCVALTRNAGAEHTARGGQRVHTHNVIFAAEDFARCGYNPFAVLRAMKAAGLASPQLNPPPVLPTIELNVDPATVPTLEPSDRDLLDTPRRILAAKSLLDSRTVAVDITDGWRVWAEALLLALPGPMRGKISLGAGLRFSVGRGHRLQVFRDEKRAAAGRASAQGFSLINAETTSESTASAWLSFVERHWTNGDLPGLTKRTSRAFLDHTTETCERIGRAYNAIDDLPRAETDKILAAVARSIAEPARGIEREIQYELRDAAKSVLDVRFSTDPWTQTQPHWNALISLWRRGGDAASFASPLIRRALHSASAADPLLAAEIALDCTREIPADGHRESLDAALDNVLSSLAQAAPRLPDASRSRLESVVRRWQSVRPACPIIRFLGQSQPAPTATGV